MRIKQVMKEKGFTQQQLADGMGVSLSAVKQMVNAESLTTATLEKMAKVMGVEVWTFFIDVDELIPKSDKMSFSCPHCGKRIVIKLE